MAAGEEDGWRGEAPRPPSSIALATAVQGRPERRRRCPKLPASAAPTLAVPSRCRAPPPLSWAASERRPALSRATCSAPPPAVPRTTLAPAKSSARAPTACSAPRAVDPLRSRSSSQLATRGTRPAELDEGEPPSPPHRPRRSGRPPVRAPLRPASPPLGLPRAPPAVALGYRVLRPSSRLARRGRSSPPAAMARAQAAEPQGGSAVRAGRPLARRRGASLPGAGRGAEPPGGRGGAAGGRPQAGTGEGGWEGERGGWE
ncbi:proline-rich protein 36-like [Panicum virgatum]|uniref:proline-rich protein 36-like n=1 Tax=Panicum virgatum TaxID=38727 RepID=UPI0019D63F75|nr:proline-rich protein 36-like [Panicum virgatum]